MYQVCLALENNEGCRSEYCREVCVENPEPEPPTAETCCDGFEAWFNYFPTQTENRIEFQNLSAGDWDFIGWNFGDGQTSTQEHPDHIYGAGGIYQVCVVIENNDGCRSELCYEVAVETTPDPCNDFLADFVWNENIDSLGIQFENICPITPDFHLWHFGDGTTSNDANPYHEYAEPGVYQVCLVIENNDDCRSEYCRSVCVEDFNPCTNFEVEFSWSESQNSGLVIEFEGNYSGDIDFIVWNFGDGESSNAEHPDHEYSEPGIYEVCLVIENNDGCRSEYCISIAVEQQNNPCNDFEADFIYGIDFENGGVHFEDLSSGNPTSYEWFFGDGGSSTVEEPTHSYNETGLFNVCLVIENEFGCIAEYCQPVFVPSYYFYLVSPLGVEERATIGSITAYPNPFTDAMRFSESISGLVQILDLQGKAVYSKEVQAINALNLSLLTKGFYLMRVGTDKGVSTIKLIKR